MNSPSSSRRGFTLVEMLVAVSILSFMLLMMAQMTGLAEQAWRLEQNRIDNFSKARSMLDMVTDDLQRARLSRGPPGVWGRRSLGVTQPRPPAAFTISLPARPALPTPSIPACQVCRPHRTLKFGTFPW